MSIEKRNTNKCVKSQQLGQIKKSNSKRFIKSL